MTSKVHYSSERQDWGTPQAFFDRLDDEFGFTLDVAASACNAKCRYWWGGCVDGLSTTWAAYRCWMNPPYGREISKWTRKAYIETSSGCPLVVGLLPSRTDTRWWHDHVMKATEVRLVKGRLKFEGAPSSAPFPSAVIIWTPYRPPNGPVFTTMDVRA